MIPLAKKVESAHSDKPECPTGLSDFLMKFQFELESHMQKEEKILFPMIKSGQGSMAHNFETPDDACGSWTALYQGAQTNGIYWNRK